MNDHHKVLVLRDGPAHVVQPPLEMFLSMSAFIGGVKFYYFHEYFAGKIIHVCLDWRGQTRRHGPLLTEGDGRGNSPGCI